MMVRGKTQAVVQELRARIHSGVWELGEKLESVPRLAAQLGTTVTTVTKAFDRLEEQGLIERLNGLGVFVRRKPGRRYALVFDSAIPGETFTHAVLFLKYFCEVAKETGNECTVFNNIDNAEDCRRLSKALQLGEYDVIVIASAYLAEHHEEYLSKPGMLPIGLYPYKWLARCVCFVDDLVRPGTIWLRAHGCTRIALITRNDEISTLSVPEVSSPKAIYQALCAEQHPCCSPELLRQAPLSSQGGYVAANELLRRVEPGARLGIISVDSLLTHGILTALLQQGRAPGDDVFLISHSNLGSAVSEFSLPLPIFAADIRAQAKTILTLADRHLAGIAAMNGTVFLPMPIQEPQECRRLQP